jgi:membrane protein required for beta-lactamase induction
MLTLSLVIAFLLDRVFIDLRGLRNRQRLHGYYQWMVSRWSERLPAWTIPVLLVAPLLIAFSLIESLIEASLWDVFLFGFYLLVAFLCIDSRVMFENLDSRIEMAEQQPGSDDADDQTLFAKTNTALYSAVFWMTVGGPLVLVFYRLVQSLSDSDDLPGRENWIGTIETLIAWLEWLPSILTCFTYMVCGNFDAGLKRFSQISIIGDDMALLNQTRLREVGLASVNASDAGSVEMLKRSRGLLLRALLFWVFLAAIIETLT